jgi:hypothetical protein
MTLYETVVVEGADGVAVAIVVVVVRGTVIVEVLFNVDVPKIALAVISSPQLFIILRQGIGPVRSRRSDSALLNSASISTQPATGF